MAITPAPAKADMFNADYAILGEYVQDDSRVPYYNDPANDELIEPGEPLLVQWNGAAEVMMAQGPIAPGEIGMLVRYFTADLPADVSANVVFGDPLMWDVDNKVLSIAADVTNGFDCGNASWHIDPLIKHKKPAIDGSSRVICATTADDYARTVVSPGAKTVKGTATVRSMTGPGPAASARKAKKGKDE